MIYNILEDAQFPHKWPYTGQDFSRIDESIDTMFYTDAQLVYYVDDAWRYALTKYYETEIFSSLSTGHDILDICSSWVCHYPDGIQNKAHSIVGLGMNQIELQQNPVLSSYVVQDLNINPMMPFPDSSFDIVTCCVSFNYLIQPIAVMKEIGRVLRPGGQCIISISNRWFPTKVIKLWTQTNDLEHVNIIGSFFHYSQCFDPPVAYDMSPNPGRTDPLYIIKATKKDSE